jgi:hypothetical protein
MATLLRRGMQWAARTKIWTEGHEGRTKKQKVEKRIWTEGSEGNEEMGVTEPELELDRCFINLRRRVKRKVLKREIVEWCSQTPYPNLLCYLCYLLFKIGIKPFVNSGPAAVEKNGRKWENVEWRLATPIQIFFVIFAAFCSKIGIKPFVNPGPAAVEKNGRKR